MFLNKDSYYFSRWSFIFILSFAIGLNLISGMIVVLLARKFYLKNKKLVYSMVGVNFVLVCGIGYAVLVCLEKRRDSRKNDHEMANVENLEMDNEFENGTGPKRFSYDELVSATRNFNEEGKLGQGGFGGVYRGFCPNLNLNVAVKRVSKGSQQGRKEYQSEVRIISRLRHRNLVKLIGWCHERNELLLVYEFMPNRSLDKHLFQGENILSWEVRRRIALGLASALLYLHELCEQCVLHRDIKSSNVMLDSDFNTKLGDFGLARLVDHGKGSQTTVAAGTWGYLAPEYATTGKFSKEPDIYSFGIVGLEIACGRKSIDVSMELSLVEWVWGFYGKGKIVEAADEKLKMEFNELEMERLIGLGLWCAHPDSKSRPSITQVISVLRFESPVPLLPLELPKPVYPAMPSIHGLPSSAGFTDSELMADVEPELEIQ